MSQEHSTPANAEDGVARLLKSSASSLSSLDSANELSKSLAPGALKPIERLIQETVERGELDRADSMSVLTERAAQIAGLEVIRYWARIRRGMIAEKQQNETRAASFFEEGFEYLDASGASEAGPILHSYFVAGEWLSDRALREKKIPKARELLARMLRRASAADAAKFEARIIIKFLRLSLSIGDLDSAEEYALRIVEGSVLDAIANDEALRDTALSFLRRAALDLYAAGETKYESARRIASMVMDKAGPDVSMMLVLALVAFGFEDFADALVWLDRLLEAPQELPPSHDAAQLYHRRTYCLLRLNRREEAVESIKRAIQSAPENPYIRFGAAQVLESLGDQNRILDAYAETIRLCEERMANPSPEAQPREQARSMNEYHSNMPIEDLRDFAIIGRAKCLRRAGSKVEAAAGLQRLASIGDESSRASALLMLAKWEEEEGHLSNSAELLTRARSFPSGRIDDIELQLASVLIGLNSFDEALDVIVPLCHKSRKAEQCVELLGRIPGSWSGFARVEKWMGYAKTEAGWPREGFIDLDAAVKADASDADTLFLRALARITFGVQPGQEDWNFSRTMRHIRESLDDLYAALRLNPNHEEARRVTKWLVERAAANPEMREIFSAGGSRGRDLFKVFPDLRLALETEWEANRFGFKREWDQAVLVWKETIHAYESAGFEIMAARAAMRLADVCLRLLDFDEVAAHLERAEQLKFLVNVPLSRDALEQNNDLIAGRGAYENPTLGHEVEYSWIYDHTTYDDLRLKFITGNYRHRLGDLEGALECVDFLEPVLAALPAYLGSIYGIEEVLWVVGILRDGERYDDALRLLDALQLHAAQTNRSFEVLYTRGTLHDAKGEPLLALDAYEKAFAIIKETSRPIGIEPHVKYVDSLFHAGREADALQALQEIDIEHAAASDRERLLYYSAAAWVYGARLAHKEALDAVEKGVTIVEKRRAEIADPASRRSWQGQQQQLFTIAVKLYVDTNQMQRAWRAVEMSKSRTLLEEIEGRKALSPQHALLIADLETIERARQAIESGINPETTDVAVAALRTEAVAELVQLLGPRFQDVLTSTSFTKRDFPAIRNMLMERQANIAHREQRMRDAASAPAVEVIDLDEVARMLED